MATSSITVNPNSGTTSNLTTSNSYPLSNAYTDTSSTTLFRGTLSSNTTGYVSFTFDLSSIPSDATINSVSCNVKAAVNNTSRVTNTAAQLYTGTTAKGSSSTFATTTTNVTVQALTCGTWTRTELDNLSLRFTGTGSNSSQNKYIYVYGAELTIEYTTKETYTVTITSTGDGTTTPTGEQTVSEGDELLIICIPNDADIEVSVTDNGTDVSDSLIQIGGEASGASVGDIVDVSAVISSYDTPSNVSGSYYQSAVGNGSDTSTTTTGNNYCSTSGSTTTIYYNFDLSSVPSGSTISSITCSVKGHLESTSSSSEVASCQLYKGSTAVGTAVSFTSTTDAVITITDCGSWTYDELSNLKLGFTIGYYGGNVTGATVTVSYIDLGDSGVGYLYDLTSISTNHTIEVVYGTITKYTVTSTISGGTMTSTNPIQVKEGKDTTLTFTKSEDDYVLKSMKVDGVSVTPTHVDALEGSESWTGTDTVTLTASTNTDEYTTDSNGIAAICDGNSSTYYWTLQTQAAGDYMMITLSELVYLTAVSSVCTKSSTDYFKSNCKLLISTDGSSWADVGTCSDSSSQSFTGINQVCQYVRFYITTASDSWWCVNEITLTYNTKVEVEEIPEHYEYTISNITGDKTVAIVFGPEGPVLYEKINSTTWKKVVTIYLKTSSGWVEMSTEDFNTLATGKKFLKLEVPESAIGSVTSSTNAINITDDTLTADTYTLYYEDADNNKLDDWDAIGTITKS